MNTNFGTKMMLHKSVAIKFNSFFAKPKIGEVDFSCIILLLICLCHT